MWYVCQLSAVGCTEWQLQLNRNINSTHGVVNGVTNKNKKTRRPQAASGDDMLSSKPDDRATVSHHGREVNVSLAGYLRVYFRLVHFQTRKS